MAKILIVDDEERIRVILKIMLTGAGHEVAEAGDGNDALGLLEKDPFDLVISDIRMGGMDGTALLAEIKSRDMGCPVVFITAFATLDSAVEAMRLGAVDYLVKPFEEKQVLLSVERALGVGRIMAENIRLKRDIRGEGQEEPVVFISSAMKNVAKMADRVAVSEATVLITGESGTGKEVLARYIHRKSDRADRRFVAVNCAAISPNLVESELFGHEKGAFTGADRRSEGKFEYADGGTLFLDEIGDLPLEAQAKLLRAIQEKRFQRVGGNREIPVNTRLVCATNQNLEKLTAEKKFRQDLFYRINVFPLHVPPLRERQKAIPHLAVHFIRKFARVAEMGGEFLTPGGARLLTKFSWPGNVRELANAMERAMILKGGALPVNSDDLDFLRFETGSGVRTEELFTLPAAGINLEAFQKDIIRQALALTSGNQSAAARILGLSRAKFRTFLKSIDYE